MKTQNTNLKSSTKYGRRKILALIVIDIIAILASMLLPTLIKARGKTCQSLCQINF